MASITVNGTVNVSSLYTESPVVNFIPFYSNFPANGFRNSIIDYAQFTQIVTIGGVATFDDGNGYGLIGNVGGDSYVKANLATGQTTIYGITVAIDGVTTTATAGGSAGKHLPISINGVNYKIALLLP